MEQFTPCDPSQITSFFGEELDLDLVQRLEASPRWLRGFLAPLATARIFPNSRLKKTTMRSASASEYWRSTMASALWVGIVERQFEGLSSSGAGLRSLRD